METQVQKWSNSLAVRIPKAVADLLNWDDHTLIRESVVGGKLIIEDIKGPVYDLDELLLNVTPDNFCEEVETGYSVGKENW